MRVTGSEIGMEIAEALGIRHCRSLRINIPSDGFVTVDAEFFVEKDGAKQFPAIFKRFELTDTRVTRMQKEEEKIHKFGEQWIVGYDRNNPCYFQKALWLSNWNDKK